MIVESSIVSGFQYVWWFLETTQVLEAFKTKCETFDVMFIWGTIYFQFYKYTWWFSTSCKNLAFEYKYHADGFV